MNRSSGPMQGPLHPPGQRHRPRPTHHPPGVTVKAPPDIAFQPTTDSQRRLAASLPRRARAADPISALHPRLQCARHRHRPRRHLRHTLGLVHHRRLHPRRCLCRAPDQRSTTASSAATPALRVATSSSRFASPPSRTISSPTASASRFAPNHTVEGFLDANHPANPNTFINNTGPLPSTTSLFLPRGGLIARARHNSLENTDSDVRNNWWGTPTGPHHPTLNPTGTGDDVFFGIDVGGFLLPFLTQPPTTNPPPVVRFVSSQGPGPRRGRHPAVDSPR